VINMSRGPLRRVFPLLAFLLLGTSPAGAQSFSSLFTTLPEDFGHLFTPSSAVVLGIGGGASLLVYPHDDSIAEWIGADSGTTRSNIFSAGDVLGDVPVQGGLALGAYIVGWAAGQARLQSAGADLIDAQIVNAALTWGLKATVHRTRPNGSAHSFPSGHSSATFATAAVLQQHYGWKVGIPFYGLGTYVGLSRMVGREHFASDVIFGTTVGIIAGRAAAFGHGRGRVAVSPTFLPGGMMVVGTVGR
jgi:membrane-associated phospholipid phosphatase